MQDILYDRIMKLPRANVVNLMWDALDYMQQWNGRSRGTCIAMAMGGKEVKEGCWELPTHKTLREYTEHMSAI